MKFFKTLYRFFGSVPSPVYLFILNFVLLIFFTIFHPEIVTGDLDSVGRFCSLIIANTLVIAFIFAIAVDDMFKRNAFRKKVKKDEILQRSDVLRFMLESGIILCDNGSWSYTDFKGCAIYPDRFTV